MTIKTFIRRLFVISFAASILMQCNSTGSNPNKPSDNKTSGDSNMGDFVSVKDGDFILGDQSFYFVGSNAYYLPTYEKFNPDVVDKTLEVFENTGIKVVRMWAFYDGPPQYDNDITIQPEAGVYNEEGLTYMDEVIAKGKEHNIRFILTLLNNWSQLGGVPQYNEWDGSSGAGMSHFINDPDTQKWYKDYIKMLLNRTNTVTDIKYKDEPAIFSWEIINEGRLPEGTATELANWYQNIAKYIKSIDSNHLVSTGEEGFDEGVPDAYSVDKYSNQYVLRAQEGTSYIQNTSIPEIDYGTAHWYPTAWGFSNIDQSLYDAQTAWLQDHKKIAQDLGKPFVIGEYGDDKGWGDQDQLNMYNHFWDTSENMKLDGSLLWQFTPTGDKCYEFGGNICYPGGRNDASLYEGYKTHIEIINKLD